MVAVVDGRGVSPWDSISESGVGFGVSLNGRNFQYFFLNCLNMLHGRGVDVMACQIGRFAIGAKLLKC